jgi:hypothetical protein
MHEARVELTWKTSSYCSSSACVEVAKTPNEIRVRNSNDPDATELIFVPAAWAEFMAGIRAGDFAERPAPASDEAAEPRQ